MESFFRYIAYVDYYKEGVKVSNVGFMKWKILYKEHAVEMKLNGLPKIKKKYDIKEINSGKEIGTITIEQGLGYFEKKFERKQASGEDYIELANERLYLKDIHGFRVDLGDEETLKIAMEFENNKVYMGEIPKKDNNIVEENPIITKYIEVTNKKVEGIPEKNKSTEFQDTEKKINNTVQKKEIKMEKIEKEKEVEIIKPIPEDKWEQLCMEYPKVHPFTANKIFLSIKPKDFIILQQDCQKKVNNSFLLHGYYNYGHMILGKLSEEETAPIYIGVPGVYYEREKQAARMFGFVGFESTEEPIQQGSYGYYMMEVSI